MVSAFIITFREALEAALIIGIILAYLFRTRQTRYNNVVYYGIASSIVASIFVAYLFNIIAGGFEGAAEEIFEGILMLFAAVLITFMILWMLRQKNIAKQLESRVQSHLSKEQRFGLFLVTFLSVFREGVETVIFLNAARLQSGNHMLLWSILGLIAACILGYVIFVMAKRVNLKLFFNVSSVLLILFAAGLTAHGIHELEEGGIIPETGELWNMNPVVNTDGSYPALHEKGVVGSIAVGLFGYNGNPSLPELIAYFAYIVVVIILWRNVDRVWKRIDTVEELVK